LLQVLLFFWATQPEKPLLPAMPLAFVRWYTTELAGAIDNTEMKRLCWELEKRAKADRCPGMWQKFDVISVADFNKLEHIVPVWSELLPGQKEIFYVNKTASFA
jgi:hypothetical protein